MLLFLIQAMQQQMRQLQTEMKTKKVHRQRSMPTRLFKPPSPPVEKKEPPVQPPQSIFDTDTIGFIDSDEDHHAASAAVKNAEVVNGNFQNATEISEKIEQNSSGDTSNGNVENCCTETEINLNTAGNANIGTENSNDTDKPVIKQISSHTVTEGGLIVPVMVESRGYVTTDDELDSDDDDETLGSDAVTPDSGLVTDPDIRSPECGSAKNGIFDATENAVSGGGSCSVNGSTGKLAAEFLDEKIMTEGFDEGIQE